MKTRRPSRRRPPANADASGAPFTLSTLDGVRLHGVVLSGPPGCAFVLCHGFCGSRRSTLPLGRALVGLGSVYLFDFRGHGASDGVSSLGDREALDVHAAVSYARGHGNDRVVTVGASMGGIAVLREAAYFRDVDGVVSVSAPARWNGHGRGARLSGLLVSNRAGRALARRVLNTHVSPGWSWTAPPADLVERIEVPKVFVHGTRDRFISPAQAELLHERARPPKRLLIIDGYGHAEAGFDERVIGLMVTEIASIAHA